MQTWGKMTSVFVNKKKMVEKCQFCAKTIEILGEMLTFSLNVPYYWKDYVIAKYAYFCRKCDEGLYTLTVSNYDKKNFLRINLCMC